MGGAALGGELQRDRYAESAVVARFVASEDPTPIVHASRKQISPPLTRLSSRAATFTPSPKMSSSLTMTSPTLRPIRKRIRRPSSSLSLAFQGQPEFRL